MIRTLLTLYCDESADQRQELVWTFAAAIGSEAEWAALEHVWRCRTGEREFHANTESEFSPHSKTPDPLRHSERLALYRDLTTILVESYVAGFCVSLDLRAYEKVFGAGIEDIGYYSCFNAVLDNVARMSRRFNDAGEAVDIAFVLDERVTAEASVRDIFATYKNQPEWSGDTTLRGCIHHQRRSTCPSR